MGLLTAQPDVKTLKRQELKLSCIKYQKSQNVYCCPAPYGMIAVERLGTLKAKNRLKPSKNISCCILTSPVFELGLLELRMSSLPTMPPPGIKKRKSLQYYVDYREIREVYVLDYNSSYYRTCQKMLSVSKKQIFYGKWRFVVTGADGSRLNNFYGIFLK